MMFYEAVGGEGFAGLPNRYQAELRPEPPARASTARSWSPNGTDRGSQWTDAATGEPLGSEQDTVDRRIPIRTASRRN